MEQPNAILFFQVKNYFASTPTVLTVGGAYFEENKPTNTAETIKYMHSCTTLNLQVTLLSA